MPHIKIKEKVDIYKLPSLDSSHMASLDTQITIGDLHANAIKLMFMLIKHGIAKNLDEQDYNRLVEIYRTPTEDLTKELLDEFNQILSKIHFSKECFVRLIGDELCDRGNNDYFTLKIFEKLKQQEVPFEVLVSNHGIEFVQVCEKKSTFSPSVLQPPHSQSMCNLQILIAKGIVTPDEMFGIAESSYRPTLRAISYSLSKDGKEITIYSHAGIGLDNILGLAKKLGVAYKIGTIKEIAETLDNINNKFQEHVRNNAVHELYTETKLQDGYTRGERADFTDAPFEFILWNRAYNNLKRPMVHAGYNINFVHGHDSSDQEFGHLYNLDNILGKLEKLNKGEYTVLYSPQQYGNINLINPTQTNENQLDTLDVYLKKAKSDFENKLNALKKKC